MEVLAREILASMWTPATTQHREQKTPNRATSLFAQVLNGLSKTGAPNAKMLRGLSKIKDPEHCHHSEARSSHVKFSEFCGRRLKNVAFFGDLHDEVKYFDELPIMLPNRCL